MSWGASEDSSWACEGETPRPGRSSRYFVIEWAYSMPPS